MPEPSDTHDRFTPPSVRSVLPASIALGRGTQQLVDVAPGDRLSGPTGVCAALETVLTNLAILDFKICISIAERHAAKALLAELTTAATESGGNSLSPAHQRRLVGLARALSDTVHAEAESAQVFPAADTRISALKLLDGPDLVFPAGVLASLPLMAQSEIKSGFRCLVVASPTAVVFHLMRAVEAVLRTLVRQRRPDAFDGTNAMWRQMTESLARPPRAIPENLRHMLDQARQEHRNPTSHPDATYNMDAAENLTFVVIDLLSRMSSELDAPPAA